MSSQFVPLLRPKSSQPVESAGDSGARAPAPRNTAEGGSFVPVDSAPNAPTTVVQGQVPGTKAPGSTPNGRGTYTSRQTPDAGPVLPAAPSVSLERDPGTRDVTRIHIRCGCGQLIELECDYSKAEG